MKKLSAFCSNLFRHTPIELSIGLLTNLVLFICLAVQAFYFNHVDFTAAEVSAIGLHLLLIGGLLVALAICAVYQPVFKRFMEKAYTVPGFVLHLTFVGFYAGLYMLIVTQVFMAANLAWTVDVSLWYLALDVKWGVYEQLDALVGYLVAQPLLYNLVATFYSQTLNAIFFGLLILSFVSLRLTRQYLIAVFISSACSAILWVTLPAIAPYQLAVTGAVVGTEHEARVLTETAPVMALYEKYPDTVWAEHTQLLVEYWEDTTENYGYAVSSNPSMHVIWGVLLTVYLWRARWYLGGIALGYSLIESIGTMLFLQHYLIDLPFGVLFGLVTVYLADRLYRVERSKLHVDAEFWFNPIVQAVRLRKRLLQALRRN